MENCNDLDGIRHRAIEDGVGEALEEGTPKSVAHGTKGFRVASDRAEHCFKG